MQFRSTTGKRLLKSLFIETRKPDALVAPVYTLRDKDHNGLPSLYRLYMEAEDPTEYTFAIANMDGWEHWQMLCAASWFQPYINRWRQELELKIKSKALRTLQELVDDGGKEALQASKALLDYEKHLEKRVKNPVGRPAKQDDAPLYHSTIDDDFSRLGIELSPTAKPN